MQEGGSYNVIGMAYLDIGKAEVAASYFEKSFSITSEIENRRGKAGAFRESGAGIFKLRRNTSRDWVLSTIFGYFARDWGPTRGGYGLGKLGDCVFKLGRNASRNRVL